jgi:hypothetical protein
MWIYMAIVVAVWVYCVLAYAVCRLSMHTCNTHTPHSANVQLALNARLTVRDFRWA